VTSGTLIDYATHKRKRLLPTVFPCNSPVSTRRPWGSDAMLRFHAPWS
jgi:hypothetical protein